MICLCLLILLLLFYLFNIYEPIENQDKDDKDKDDKGKDDKDKDKDKDDNDKDDKDKDKGKGKDDKDDKDKGDKDKDDKGDKGKGKVDYRMGKFDGLCLQQEYKEPTFLSDKQMVAQGHTVPGEEISSDFKDLKGPWIDGIGDSQGLYMYRNNKASPECCEISNISTSNGCICPMRSQINYLNKRGLNNP